MAEHQAEQVQACAVCERTILRGERVTAYATPDGAEHGVCALCRDRAEAAGWVRADLVGTGGHVATPRRRGGLRLRERVRRYAERARPPRPEPADRPPEQSAGETTTSTAPERPATVEPAKREAPTAKPKAEPETRQRRLRRAVERFNQSDQVRVVAGLMRSLGEPTAAVEDVSAEPARARVTIAWELSWYRWEVAPDGDGQAVREVAKGDELTELGGGEPEWNASVDGEGRVRWQESS